MKRAIKALSFNQVNDYFDESERSGDPRSEFHTVRKRLKAMTQNT